MVQIKHTTAYKHESFESVMKTYVLARIRFDVKFYLYALLFILFDIETIFLFPWAVAYEKVGVFALVEMLIFVGILALGIVYAWRKGALRWQ
ncbi:MAG: NADH-quinone oxidoreductase subunit A [Vampirovibrionales bacterium]